MEAISRNMKFKFNILILLFVFFAPFSAFASVLNFSGFKTGNNAEFNSTSGTTSIQTSVKRTGDYAFRANPTTTNVGYGTMVGLSTTGENTSYSVATAYITMYFRVDTIPASNDDPILVFMTSALAVKLELRLNSSGQIAAYDSALSLLGTGSTALSTGTWYRLEISCGTAAGSAGAWEVKINGASEISGTGTLLNVNNSIARLGKWVDRNGNSVDFFYDDVWIDNSAFIGAHEVKILIPNANGSTMQWTNGTGSSDYQEVDEIPTSATDYVRNPASGGGEIALFDVQDTSTASITGTINALKGMVNMREDTSTTSSTNLRFRSGSTNSDTTALNLNFSFNWYSKLFGTDPDTSSAWTSSGVDGVEIGAIENNTLAIRLATAYVTVSYTPSSTDARRKVITIL